MKVLGIIPARYASTRYPGKPLIDIKGKSMIQRVYEQACKTSFSKIIIATDDQRIFNHVKLFGAEVMMTKSSHINGSERCAEVLAQMHERYDVVVNIQGDEPFVDPKMLQQVVSLFDNDQTEIGTLIKKIEDPTYLTNTGIIKVVKNNKNEALYFSRSPIPFERNKSENFSYYKHIGIYAFRTDVLPALVNLEAGVLETVESLEQLRWLENDYRIKLFETTLEADSIDSPEDLVRLLQKYT